MYTHNMIDFKTSAHLFVDSRAASGGISESGEAVRWPQIVVNNLPRSCNKNEINRYFNSVVKVPVRKLKIVPQKTFCFLTFEQSEDMEKAIVMIKENLFKNNVLEPVERTNNNRDNYNTGVKRSFDDMSNSAPPAVISARSAVCPLWEMPYEMQLQQKQDSMRRDCLLEVVKAVKNFYKTSAQAQGGNPVPEWVKNLTVTNADNCNEEDVSSSTSQHFRYLDIVPSPQIYGYRNKCEFNFGYASASSNGDIVSTESPPVVEGETPALIETLGFRVKNELATPYDCPNIPNAKKYLVHEFKKFMKTSKLRVYDSNTKKGCMRILTTRYSRVSKEFILMLTVSLRDTDKDLWMEELSTLAHCLSALKRPVNLDDEQKNIIDLIGGRIGSESVQFTDEPLSK